MFKAGRPGRRVIGRRRSKVPSAEYGENPPACHAARRSARAACGRQGGRAVRSGLANRWLVRSDRVGHAGAAHVLPRPAWRSAARDLCCSMISITSSDGRTAQTTGGVGHALDCLWRGQVSRREKGVELVIEIVHRLNLDGVFAVSLSIVARFQCLPFLLGRAARFRWQSSIGRRADLNG